MKNDPIVRATIRFAIEELASFAPAVLIWAFVLGAADVATMLVLWLLRVAGTSLVWSSTIDVFRGRLDEFDELDDRELLARDEAMARAPGRFGRVYSAGFIANLVLGSLLGLLAFPRPMTFGAAELISAAMVLPVAALLSTLMQTWIWEPFEPVRAEIGRVLSARRLLGRRASTSLVRVHLLRGGLLTLATFAGLAGIAGARHVEGRRATAQVEQQRRAELSALELRTTGSMTLDAIDVVEDTELPAFPSEAPTRSMLVVGLAGTEAVAAAPIGDGRWTIARAEVDEQLGWFLAIALGVGLAFAVPVMGTTLAGANSLTQQLLELGKAIRQLGQTGRIRDVARVVPLRNDEVDTLFNDFNDMLDMLDELTDAASKVASGDLRNQLERPGDLHDAFRAMVERLHAMVVQIRSTSLDLASAASEIHSITQEQERAVNQQSLRMREVSDTVASLASSAESITRTSADVLDNADQTLRTTNAMILRIGELGAQAASVGQLLDLIREIADRSDLLALNGSLEATRVGEAGRGFALVAAEMRRLAERVTQTVGDVRERVVEIKTAGSNTVVVAEDSRKLAEQTASAARQISQVTHRQSRETELAAQTVHEITGVVIATAGATSQTRAAAEGLREQAERLERLTRQFTLRTPEKVA
ncbi:methyl-accepting chemotaxis protein [Nannocystaceae bacterium ST9]